VALRQEAPGLLNDCVFAADARTSNGRVADACQALSGHENLLVVPHAADGMKALVALASRLIGASLCDHNYFLMKNE
jgi:hypothetical protein